MIPRGSLRGHDKGSMAVVTAIFLPIVMVIGALVIDVGALNVQKMHIFHAAEQAAAAGSAVKTSDEVGERFAEDVARRILKEGFVPGDGTVSVSRVEESDGVWIDVSIVFHPSLSVFDASGASSASIERKRKIE